MNDHVEPIPEESIEATWKLAAFHLRFIDSIASTALLLGIQIMVGEFDLVEDFWHSVLWDVG